MIDKSAILIRPYTKEDNDQVISMLLTGFAPVGERYFQERAKTYSTVLAIFTQSLIYSTLIELALTAYRTSTSSSFTFDDFSVLKETLNQPETVQGMIARFLKPSFVALFAVVTMIVAVVYLVRLYKYCTSGTDVYIQEQLKDDMADISAYYQSGQNSEGEGKIESTERDTRSKTKAAKEIKSKKAEDRSHFWVACLASHPQVILGCVGAEDLYAHQDHLRMKHEKMNSGTPFEVPSMGDCELRRMSVHPNYRRLGIGKILMAKLKEHAIQSGFKRIVLSTTFYHPEAIAGYKKFGFVNDKVTVIDEDFHLWFGSLDLSEP
ncbi:hypothetical protein EMPS_11378 [Entomortierella parvispora]|uniref:N-acetyltransferase domain-containing protein n=1 Tax=Entomortierella parvispora TaxID=205924 RepID=A0A9P3HLM6_9FUNG|nr:hypothetical protein EMPS_11378 [Entomortierella parvispora]